MRKFVFICGLYIWAYVYVFSAFNNIICISEGFILYKWINDSVSLYFSLCVYVFVYVKGFILPEIGNHTQATSSDIQTKWLIKLYYLLNKSLADSIVCIAHTRI